MTRITQIEINLLFYSPDQHANDAVLWILYACHIEIHALYFTGNLNKVLFIVKPEIIPGKLARCSLFYNIDS